MDVSRCVPDFFSEQGYLVSNSTMLYPSCLWYLFLGALAPPLPQLHISYVSRACPHPEVGWTAAKQTLYITRYVTNLSELTFCVTERYVLMSFLDPWLKPHPPDDATVLDPQRCCNFLPAEIRPIRVFGHRSHASSVLVVLVKILNLPFHWLTQVVQYTAFFGTVFHPFLI